MLLGRGLLSSASALEALPASQIIQKAVASSQKSAARSEEKYRYSKQSVVEELDSKGRLKERKEKVYDVLFDSGFTSLKLIRINGQQLSGAQLKKQEEMENEERQKWSRKKSGHGGDDREVFLTADLVEKYFFKLIDEQSINGRSSYHLSFRPQSGNLPERELSDRLLNHLVGEIWIDGTDFEIARVDVHLQSEVNLLGGVIGSLKRFTFTLDRTRLDDGHWFNCRSQGDFEGRKLLEPMRIKTRSESVDFSKVRNKAS